MAMNSRAFALKKLGGGTSRRYDSRGDTSVAENVPRK